MPPRPSPMTSSFSVSEAGNEVVCPLKNLDGSPCRKRCIGEKRFRSMQEHIRRAHPEHYIPKLPATEESFVLMINTPPSERPPPVTASVAPPSAPPVAPSIDPYLYQNSDYSSSGLLGRSSDEYGRGSMLPATNAAEALAALHGHRIDFMGFEHEQVGQTLLRRPCEDTVTNWGSVCACNDCCIRDMNLRLLSFESPIRLETFL